MLSIDLQLSGPVYKVDQVPENFHESFIIKGYRNPKSSAVQCILSIFDATNETLNFWTHFLPCWYFLWIFKGLSAELDFRHDAYTWPLFSYMFASCLFPLASATAHVFNTMSDKARHVCFFVDYAALSVFSYGVAISYRAYVFPMTLRQSWFRDVYLVVAIVNAVVCTVVSCQTRFMAPSTWQKIMRMGAFAGPYIYDSVPVFFSLLLGTEEENQLESQYYHRRQFAFTAVSAFLYATHIPERLHPGRFDIIGHSHQWFHMFSILATIDQMRGIVMDMKQRRAEIMSTQDYPPFFMCMGVMSLVLTNVFIVLYYSIKLYKQPDITSIPTRNDQEDDANCLQAKNGSRSRKSLKVL